MTARVSNAGSAFMALTERVIEQMRRLGATEPAIVWRYTPCRERGWACEVMIPVRLNEVHFAAVGVSGEAALQDVFDLLFHKEHLE